MGVVYDWDDVFPFCVEGAGFADEAGFASMVAAVGFELEGVAEEAQHVVPGVEGAVDDGGDPVFRAGWDGGVEMDREGAPAAGVPVAVGAKKRRPRVNFIPRDYQTTQARRGGRINGDLSPLRHSVSLARTGLILRSGDGD